VTSRGHGRSVAGVNPIDETVVGVVRERPHHDGRNAAIAPWSFTAWHFAVVVDSSVERGAMSRITAVAVGPDLDAVTPISHAAR
jgi:hypothetical protein